MPDAREPPEPRSGFEDSRRLPGPNRWFATPAVELTALTAATRDVAALEFWAQRVRSQCAALGWPDPQPLSRRHARGATLAFTAPAHALLTATEINEWAWERAAGACGALAAEGITPTQPATDDMAALVAIFAARADAEISRPLARLRAAAATHHVPVFDDDDSVSLGAGSGSRCWPRAALPLPMDVPWPRLHDVPTALVTGSNGKTTTVRLLAAMATAAGFDAGYCCTEGVFVAGESVAHGDYAGPAGARAVLRHPRVRLAVLETARGGILRRGLAVARADVAVVTNISADHLGEYGVENADDLATVKLVVARAVAHGGVLVLNADDPVVMAGAARLPHATAARCALFAQERDHPALVALRSAGGSTCGVAQGHLVLDQGDASHDLGALTALPLTLAGAARHNVENAAAAALAAAGLGLPLAAIRDTLARFGSRPQDNPGRLACWTHRGATVLVDYAHNPEGLAQLLQVARTLAARPAAPGAEPAQAHARLGLLLGQAGNRDDAAITELARTAARFAPDRVVVKELPLMLRGRAPGDVPALICQALYAAGVDTGRVTLLPDEEAAALELLAWARPGDVIVLPVHTTAVRERLTARLGDGRSSSPAPVRSGS